MPRIPPLPEEAWNDELRAVVSATGPLHVFTTLARHPELFRAWLGLGTKLLTDGLLDGRVREMAILRVAHHRRSEYEWVHHSALGRREGLTEDEIAALRLDLDAHPWDERDRAVVAAVDELHADGTVGDATWAALAARFDERELIELVLLVGFYQLTAFALNSLGVEVEDRP
ncbi:Carboxymuconolactone decarboxylase family protein [Actinomadura rubteroloni]|uniref:Carboxymuconolactone decarboxylase family protein n=1 Tax=Actinomadura rubteroloni TaxID=1926885 RepID=A0A2P4UGA8_9ACTN|nr:carboxymuconolactone decarboxylase family protein [Actinomadura rubteroloni]POM24104.1 Carboxymuconolactone decarboxylase family protein [Actinomadura rubteroloni]